MAQYSPEFLALLQHRYEKTDQPMIEIARDFGIGVTTLQSLVDKHGFEKRSQRLRGLPRALRLQKEAEALAARMPAPLLEEIPTPTLPLSGGGGHAAHAEKSGHTLASPPPERGSSPAAQSDGGRVEVIGADQTGARQATPSPTLPLSAEGSESVLSKAGSANADQSPVERLERLVMQEIADLESARDMRAGRRVSGAGAERTAQALASLTRTLQTIRHMRGGHEQPPREAVDIDERRRRLAERIREFVRSRQGQDAASRPESRDVAAQSV